MKKVLVTAIALFALCNIVFADLVIDMEIGSTNSTVTQPNIGGSGTHSITLPANSTGPQYIWVYGKITKGPVVTNPLPTGHTYDDAMLSSAQGTITETSAGVHGDMTWGLTHGTNGTKATYVYNSGWPLGSPDFSSGSLPVGITNGYGDLDISDPGQQFADLNATGGNETGDYVSWIPIGHFTYTVKPLSAGSATITFHPDLTGPGALYQFYDSVGDFLSNPYGGTSGYTTTGSLTITVVPEPSTLILLGMSALALLAIRRRK